MANIIMDHAQFYLILKITFSWSLKEIDRAIASIKVIGSAPYVETVKIQCSVHLYRSPWPNLNLT